MITREELDEAVCDCGGATCDSSVVYFTPRCCEATPVLVRYRKGTRCIEIVCASCEQLVVDVLVGKQEGEKH